MPRNIRPARCWAKPPSTISSKNLAGRAKVVLLTHDSNQFLARRFVAMRDQLARLPGVTIVADISPPTVDRKGGFTTMQTILLAQPTVDVVLGADTVVLGALDALRQAGKDRPDQFLGGIDGEPDAVAEIKAGGPYKASVSLASPVFGYAMGQHAADWLEGKSIPQAMDILPMALNAENYRQYEADLADPGAVYADPARRERLSADVRQHLLRHARQIPQFPLVFRALISHSRVVIVDEVACRSICYGQGDMTMATVQRSNSVSNEVKAPRQQHAALTMFTLKAGAVNRSQEKTGLPTPSSQSCLRHRKRRRRYARSSATNWHASPKFWLRGRGPHAMQPGTSSEKSL